MYIVINLIALFGINEHWKVWGWLTILSDSLMQVTN